MTEARQPRKSRALRVGILLLLVLLATGLAGIFVDPNPAHRLADALAPPSWRHWLGCDAYGADLGGRILAGAWWSLRVTTVVTAITMGIGLAVGTAAAMASPPLAGAITRIIDSFMAFPGLLLAILLASIMPHSEATIVFALSATGWTGRARFCRAVSTRALSQPFVEAARASGASTARIVVRHVWPSFLGQFLVQGARSLGHVIIAEASLSFLGLGGTLDNASWGRLLAEGREYLVEAPHLSIVPGLVFVLAVVAFNLTAEGLRNALDPGGDVGVY